MFLNIPKLKEYAEERINWFKYGADETPETKAKVSFYNNIFYKNLPKFAEDYIKELNDKWDHFDTPNDGSIDELNELQSLIEKLEAGEFDLFEEKDD